MKKLLFILIATLSYVANAQEDLLNELEGEVTVDTKTTATFKGLKIVNLESTKLAAKGDLYFIIAHRFGSVKGGFSELFGLDESNIRFSFIYGFTDWFTAGLSRSSVDKTYDLTSKIKLLSQDAQSFPLSVVAFGSIAKRTGTNLLNTTLYPGLEDKHRYNYLAELLISRKMSEKLSLQIAPMVIHENFVAYDTQANTQYGLGFGGRYKLSKRFTFNVDYVSHFNRDAAVPFVNPLSVGFDIETGGHVFQVHFTNSRQMNDSGFINADGDWGNGDFFFGFNLSRVF